jgi:cell division protein FtsB
MVRPTETEFAEPADPFDGRASDEDGEAGIAADAPGPVTLDGLSIAGITRRRAAFVLLALVTIWIVAVFVRQVGDASAATARADGIRSDNVELSATVASLQAELGLIQQQQYIEQQARGYGLGTTQERPFALAPDASPLASDAPGSAAVRLGATVQPRSPLETWLSLLFGPAPTR